MRTDCKNPIKALWVVCPLSFSLFLWHLSLAPILQVILIVRSSTKTLNVRVPKSPELGSLLLDELIITNV